MSTDLAKRLTKMLIASGTVKEEDRELYEYGCFLLISRGLFLLATVLMGFLLGIPGTGLLFYLLYMPLRGYAGGIHAKTERACTVLTTLAMAGALAAIRLMVSFHAHVVPILMLGIGGVEVLAFSPLDTEEKPLEDSERIHYRKISVLLLLAYLLLALLAYVLTLGNVTYAIACAVFLEGILLTAGKLSRRHRRNRTSC